MERIEKPIDVRREDDDRKAKPAPDGAGDKGVAGGERIPGGGTGTPPGDVTPCFSAARRSESV